MIDFNVLVSVCQDLLRDFEAVPNRKIVEEYNKRCPAECVAHKIYSKFLVDVMPICGGEMSFYQDGRFWGIIRAAGDDG